MAATRHRDLSKSAGCTTQSILTRPVPWRAQRNAGALAGDSISGSAPRPSRMYDALADPKNRKSDAAGVGRAGNSCCFSTKPKTILKTSLFLF